MMANLAAINEFGHFGSQQPVAAIGTGGRRQIALELHGRVILGSSLTWQLKDTFRETPVTGTLRVGY